MPGSSHHDDDTSLRHSLLLSEWSLTVADGRKDYLRAPSSSALSPLQIFPTTVGHPRAAVIRKRELSTLPAREKTN